MLDRTRSLRLVLVAVSGLAAGLFPIIGPLHVAPAYADDDEDDEDDGGDDGDDGGGDEEGEDEEEEEDEDQPPITAGGLYTIKTYPQGEIQRPLTMTKGITELRGGVGFDVSNETAFETVGVAADVRHGLQDNVELRAGFKGIKNFELWSAYAAFEGSIVYDLVDFRAGVELAKTAGATTADDSSVGVSIPIGFPFRYAPKEQVAVTALETAFSIEFDSKPDFTPNVGIVIQPQPIVALLLKASLVVKDFNFSDTSNVVVPATAAIQLSPNNRLDAGAEFTFGNMKPADPDGDGPLEAKPFYDDRFILFFARYRL